MADDYGFAGMMGVWNAIAQRLPTKRQVRLLAHRQVRQVGRMKEDVGLGLVVINASLEKRKVLVGDQAHVRRRGGAIGSQGREAAHDEEGRGIRTVPGLEKHVVVVAQDRNQPALTGKGDQSFQDTPAVRTAVNVIAERDDDVVRLGIDRVQNRIQGQEAAVNVTNRDGSCSRGGRHSLNIKRRFPSARQLVRRFRDQAALRTGSGNLCSGSVRSRRQVSSSPLRRAASSAAKASTPWGDQLIPWSLQRADTAQSLYFSTRVLAIHNPARCRCW